MENLQDPDAFRSLLEHAASEALTQARDFNFPRHVPQAFEGPVHAVEGAFIGLMPLLKKILVALTTGSALFCSSVALYGLFYFAVMPGHHAVEPIFFDYSGITKHPAPVCVSNNDVDSYHGMLSKEVIEEAPWAVADLFSKHTQWEPFQSDVVPKPLTDTRILKEAKPYYLEVALDLPESEINHMAGMFGVLVELQSSDGSRLASSMRAARLPHESRWISDVRKCLWLVPLILGAAEESRRVIVPSFRHFVESSETPLQFVTVRLIMKGNIPLVVEPLEVTKGEIRIGKELSDFQLLLKEWFFTCYVACSSFLFFFQLLGLVVVRAYLGARARRRMHEDPSVNLGNLEGGGSQFGSHGSHGGRDEWEDLPQQPAESNQQGNEGNNYEEGDTEGVASSSNEANEPEAFAPPTPSLRNESMEESGL